MIDRYSVHTEHLGDDEIRYGVWDSLARPQRCLHLFRTEAPARDTAYHLNRALLLLAEDVIIYGDPTSPEPVGVLRGTSPISGKAAE